MGDLYPSTAGGWISAYMEACPTLCSSALGPFMLCCAVSNSVLWRQKDSDISPTPWAAPSFWGHVLILTNVHGFLLQVSGSNIPVPPFLSFFSVTYEHFVQGDEATQPIPIFWLLLCSLTHVHHLSWTTAVFIRHLTSFDLWNFACSAFLDP